MNIAFVSTMNLNLYHYYGKRFLEEFSKNASKEIKLFIIFEGEYPEEALHISDNIFIITLANDAHTEFFNKFSSLAEAQGLRVRLDKNDPMKINFRWDYRFNALRFSFKPFSIYQSLDFIPKDLDFLIWTDADLRCKMEFKTTDLAEFLPDENEIMSYLGREGSYSECGFLGFNMKLEGTKKYIERMINIYTSGEIFSLEQWHDSFIWDFVRIEFQKNYNYKFKDISGNAHDKEHVFINTGLGKFFDHLKGGERKKIGHSKPEDLEKKINNKPKLNT